jgi:hypothetical protein
MGYKTETSGPVPCACGLGTIQYSRKEHDVYVTLSDTGWATAEIDCGNCSHTYTLQRFSDGWFFVPKGASASNSSGLLRAQDP